MTVLETLNAASTELADAVLDVTHAKHTAQLAEQITGGELDRRDRRENVRVDVERALRRLKSVETSLTNMLNHALPKAFDPFMDVGEMARDEAALAEHLAKNKEP